MKRIGMGFLDFFRELPDPRINRHKIHPINEILLLTFCGIIAGCDGWNDIEFYGKNKLQTLKRYLPFKAGVPSDDTLRRFFRALDAEKFEEYFHKWVKTFQLDFSSKVIAIDGKTSRGSFDEKNRPLHLLSAYATEYGLTLGQTKVNEKTNEITAIPELLDMLDITNATVTIDAMGCQTKIADKIAEKQGNYIFSLKENHGNLYRDVERLFTKKIFRLKRFSYKKKNKGHGRIETRKCVMIENIEWLRMRHPKWKNIQSLIEIESTREIKDIVTVEKRYYITSLGINPKNILNAVKQHWGIENKLHWVLDVCFGDDKSRIRKGNAARNINIIKKISLNVMRALKKIHPRVSFKLMRKATGWDDGFLHSVLMTQF